MNQRVLLRVVLLVTIVAILAAVVVAYSSSDEAPEEASPVQAGAAWRSLANNPLSPRRAQAVAWSGDVLFVFGGEVPRNDRQIEPLSDGAFYDPQIAEWIQTAEAPFEKPLFRPGAVWAGDTFLIVGVPCGPTNLIAPVPTCNPGGFAAATYDPETDEWAVHDLPAEAGQPNGGYAGGVEALGADAQAAYFNLGGRLWQFRLDAGSVSPLPSPPVGDRFSSCFTTNGLVASGERLPADVENTEPEPSNLPPAALPGLPIASVLGDGRWSAAQVPSVPNSLIATQPIISDYCTDGGIFAVVQPGGSGGQQVARRFDVPTRRWEALPPPMAPVGSVSTAGWTGQELVLFGAEAVSRYVPVDRVWRTTAPPLAEPVERAIWIGDRFIIETMQGPQHAARLEIFS